jgi:hypothetical protein
MSRAYRSYLGTNNKKETIRMFIKEYESGSNGSSLGREVISFRDTIIWPTR